MLSRGLALAAFVSLALIAARAELASAPTFSRDIAPVVYRNCAPCHHVGGAGPFPLVSYNDVKTHARQIADVTERHYMPPWPPERGYGEFQDERGLTAEQIRCIANWVRAGAPEGAPADAPEPPEFVGGWQLGPPDLVLTASHPFTMAASGPDIFWNFVFRPDLKTVRNVRANEIQPGGAEGSRNVHHANLLVDRTGSVARLEKSPGTGFPGMDVTIDRNPFDPDSHFLFWKPGSLPYSEPDGLAWQIAPGNLLVLNTHIQASGKTEQIAPKVGLYFTDKPPTRFPLLIQLENDNALNIPAGARDFAVADDFRIPVDVDALAVYPHAHYLGHVLEAYATLPGGTRRWLIRIPDWDLNWQAVYRYRAPVFLPKGSVISMRYQYDNSAANPRNPNHPPKRVEAGDQAKDEMAHLWLQVLPRGEGDHRREIQEALMGHRLERSPGDFTAHLNLGAILMSRLDMQGAIGMLERAVRIDPSSPEAHDMLGSALTSVGRSAEGMAQFRLALRADPEYTSARYNLSRALTRAGVLLERAGKLAEALEKFDEALALNPANQEAHRSRQVALQQNAAR